MTGKHKIIMDTPKQIGCATYEIAKLRMLQRPYTDSESPRYVRVQVLLDSPQVSELVLAHFLERQALDHIIVDERQVTILVVANQHTNFVL